MYPYELMQARYFELLAEADQYRLAQAAAPAHSRRQHRAVRPLARFAAILRVSPR